MRNGKNKERERDSEGADQFKSGTCKTDHWKISRKNRVEMKAQMGGIVGRKRATPYT